MHRGFDGIRLGFATNLMQPATKSAAPVLVTGSHRSGSTWVGRVLAAADGVGYIHEPFTLNQAFPPTQRDPKHWYQYFERDTGKHYEAVLRDTIEFRYPFWSNLFRVRSRTDLRAVRSEAAVFRRHAINGSRAIIKDPIALFSAPWIAETFGAQIVVCIRHPAAFASSLKALNWPFDFSNFLLQPRLMEGPLAPFSADISRLAGHVHSIHEQAALLWRCIYSVVDRYRKNYPGWLFVRHEDLSRDPVARFSDLFQHAGLKLSARAQAEIARTTSGDRTLANDPRSVVRHSGSNICMWKSRLSHEEINSVKQQTADVWPKFYSNEDW
ncbi:MAG: sulfotransferase [Pseudomonadota bacterium]